MSALQLFSYAFAGVVGAGLGVCVVSIAAWVVNILLDR